MMSGNSVAMKGLYGKMIKGDKVAIVCCSNGQSNTKKKELESLKKTLEDIGLVPVFSNYIYQKAAALKEAGGRNAPVESGTPQERAKELMDFYKEKSIRAIFDISGGDLANTILPYLDYELIASSNKQFWGYSDLTTILNAIYARTGKTSVLYQIRNLLYAYSRQQKADFVKTIFDSTESENKICDLNGNKQENRSHRNSFSEEGLYQFSYKFYQGNTVEGIVVGGNIRCFLKLAGTPYFPDLTDKILLLEAKSGKQAQLLTYFSQLEQAGAFQKVKGLLLGTFTQMEEEGQASDVYQLLKRYVTPQTPVIKTNYIGHGPDSKAIKIGTKYRF